MKHSNEALWWSLFSAGGVLSATFMPAIILLTGFILPFAGEADGSISLGGVHGVVSNWFVRTLLFVIFSFSFFHCMHRIRHMLLDLGLRGAPRLLSIVCYGGAITGAGAAAWVLVSL